MSYIWIHRKKIREKHIKSLKFPFERLTKEHMALITFRKDHESGKATELYLIWHSVVTAISFAFFIGLFSTGKSYSESNLLFASSIFFAISLTMNATFCMFYQLANELKFGDGGFLFKIHLVKRFEYTRTIAMLSPIIGTVLLISYYSILALLIALIAFAITFFIICKTLGSYTFKIESEIRQKKLEAIKNDDFETQDLLDRLYGP
ncbi:hypothetical protein [Yersinia intermedia]|uniref:hypothetical protein n=1 Tax=Yersinia intermedia TaxID=631 RepID=UPI0011A021F2|nr:hypothetical protein [Yersinia intermedia]MDN0114135.1 hypothetical protein [Yersinia intermedia]